MVLYGIIRVLDKLQIYERIIKKISKKGIEYLFFYNSWIEEAHLNQEALSPAPTKPSKHEAHSSSFRHKEIHYQCLPRISYWYPLFSD